MGFIGAGKVGCSLGKYFAEQGFSVAGYYSQTEKSAREGAHFTGSTCYTSLEELVRASDTLFLSVPDDEIASVWDCIAALANQDLNLLRSKIICHFSGSLSSDIFLRVGDSRSVSFGIHPASVHPMLAFPSKFGSWQQVSHAYFTVEGDSVSQQYFLELFHSTNNGVSVISADKKPVYHAAASMLSNQICALLQVGIELFTECGFSQEKAYAAAAPLIRANVENVLCSDAVAALTGPVERGDAGTIERHLLALEGLGGDSADVYRVLARRLVKMARQKHPERDFQKMESILK